jgi:hypothetical protein
MEAMAVCGVTSFLGASPCRCCEIRKQDVWDLTSVSETSFRDSDEIKLILSDAFASFCRKMKRVSNNEDNLLLKKLHNLTLFPVVNSLFLFDNPYECFTGYLLSTADLLHTLLSGLFRDWIVYTVVICNYSLYYVIILNAICNYIIIFTTLNISVHFFNKHSK